ATRQTSIKLTKTSGETSVSGMWPTYPTAHMATVVPKPMASKSLKPVTCSPSRDWTPIAASRIIKHCQTYSLAPRHNAIQAVPGIGQNPLDRHGLDHYRSRVYSRLAG